MFYRVMRRIFIILSYVLMPVRVYGKENINRDGKYIIACNHQSYMDVPALIIACRRSICFMAKATFFDHKIIGYFFKKMNAFPVNTRTGDVDSLRHAMKVLKEDNLLGIFPQGKRIKTGPMVNREDLLSGVALIALKTGAPIVPCMFESRPLMFKINRLHVGRAISMEEYKGRICNELLSRVTDELCCEMNSLLPQKLRTNTKMGTKSNDN